MRVEKTKVIAVNIADPKFHHLHQWANEVRNDMFRLMAYSHDEQRNMGKYEKIASPLVKQVIDSFNRRFEPLLDEIKEFHERYESGQAIDVEDMPAIVPAADFLKIIIMLAANQLQDHEPWRSFWDIAPLVPVVADVIESQGSMPELDFAAQWERTKDKNPAQKLEEIPPEIVDALVEKVMGLRSHDKEQSRAERQLDKAYIHSWMRKRRQEWQGLLSLLEAVALATDPHVADLDAATAIQNAVDGLHDLWHQDNPDSDLSCSKVMKLGLKTLLLANAVRPNANRDVELIIKRILEEN